MKIGCFSVKKQKQTKQNSPFAISLKIKAKVHILASSLLQDGFPAPVYSNLLLLLTPVSSRQSFWPSCLSANIQDIYLTYSSTQDSLPLNNSLKPLSLLKPHLHRKAYPETLLPYLTRQPSPTSCTPKFTSCCTLYFFYIITSKYTLHFIIYFITHLIFLPTENYMFRVAVFESFVL